MTTLAEPNAAPTAEAMEAVRGILAARAGMPGALLPILHDVQDQLGYVPSAAVPVIAVALNLSRAEVHGVVTYYHHFRSAPAACNVLQICRAESCKSMGADALMAHAELKLGCGQHQNSKDGLFTLEPVYCLGLCSSSPALMLGDELHARVTKEDLDALIDDCRSAA